MINLFHLINGIFEKATQQITRGIYDVGASIFNNEFFTSVFALFILYVGFLIAFRKIQTEELAYKLVWTICIFSLVKAFMYDRYYYEMLVSFLNLPMSIFTEMISRVVHSANSDADIATLINVLYTASDNLTETILKEAGWSNISAYIYGFVVWVTSTFLILIILLTTVFSTFLAKVILALGTFIVPFMLIKKTEYIFYSWCKLYISVSLYVPFTVLFGLVAIETANLTMNISKTLETDFNNNIQLILALVVAQALTIVAIFKIPNIINQIIGSSNEGSSLTSGVGTVSAGATAVGAFSKFTGLNFVSKAAQSSVTKASSSIAKKSSEKWNDIRVKGGK
ncbi:conjugal transfer protein TrbL [Halarcobacter ebronensis]|uniref:Conjugal transfer protein TrbL n=1 Tax=Halarcobacter ebronensis TaxID=1462615 RepID=A0A4Q0YCZ4_9BACT|nr:type IV secretion system protein [Halarcobacter ebronensis]RXJ68296.1 conjugal transfer protein TrbL [Halarcobacter ebronensis]